MKPLITIGVVTYRRQGMLKECLSSILGQTFTDFEIIVGNDFPGEFLSTEVFDIHDPRVRIINQARNLGEIENGNVLLRWARGKYFTWLDDDDMYAPSFLESVYASLVKFDFPPCVFTSYMSSGESQGWGNLEGCRLWGHTESDTTKAT